MNYFLVLCFLLLFKNGYSHELFRSDYTFLSATNSYYKIVTLSKNWENAKWRCEIEGASLFYPEDVTELRAVLRHWIKTQSVISAIFAGISLDGATGKFKSIDGRAFEDIYNKWGVGEPNNVRSAENCLVLRPDGTYNDDHCLKVFPYICKKTLASVKWNSNCHTPYSGVVYGYFHFNLRLDNVTFESEQARADYDKKTEIRDEKEESFFNYLSNTILEYVRDEDGSRCYKFHLKPLNWVNAVEACDAEQGYLAIINTQDEADILVNMTKHAAKDAVEGDFLRGFVHVGFNWFEDEWKTIGGETIQEAGYSVWGDRQPDGGDEWCGAMAYDGKLHDVSCQNHKSFFICELEVKAFSFLSEKFHGV